MKKNYNQKKSTIGCLTLVMLFCMLFSNGLQAQDRFTWTGAEDTDWTNEANWNKRDGAIAGRSSYPGEKEDTDWVRILSGISVLNTNKKITVSRINLGGTLGVDCSLTIGSGTQLTITTILDKHRAINIVPKDGNIADLINKGSITIDGVGKGIYISGKINSTVNFTNEMDGVLDVTIVGNRCLQIGNSNNVVTPFTFTNNGEINMTSTDSGIPIDAGKSDALLPGKVIINNNEDAIWTVIGGTGRIRLSEDGIFNNKGILNLNSEVRCRNTSGTTAFNNLSTGTLTFTGSNNDIALAASVIFNNEGGTLNTNIGSTNGVSLESVNSLVEGVSGLGDPVPGVLSPGGEGGFGVVNVSTVSALFAPEGILEIQISGNTNAGDDYDQLNVITSTNTDFDISKISLDVNGIYSPNTGTTIDILTINGTGTITNALANVTGLDGTGWEVKYDYTNGKVQLVYFSVWTGALSSDWNDAGNWTTTNVPDSQSVVIIPDVANDPIIGADISIQYMIIAAGASVTVNEDVILTNTGNILNAGSLILVSGISGTASLLSDDTIDNVTQQRYLSSNQRGWRMLSNPLSTITFGTLASGSTTPITLGDDASGEWNPDTGLWKDDGIDTDPMISQQAYKVFIRGRADEVNGKVYNVETPSNVTLSITGTAQNAQPNIINTVANQYYLVGNPYTAPVSVLKIRQASSSLRRTVAYYDPSIGAIDPKIKAGGHVYVNVTINDVVLPPMGAIFMEGNNSNGEIVIPKTAIDTDDFTGGIYTHKAAVTKAMVASNGLTIKVTSNGVLYDELTLKFKEVGTEGTDIDFGKLLNTNLDFFSLTEDNKEMAVSELELIDQIIPLGIWSAHTQNYSFTIIENSVPTDFEVVLVDKFLNTETILTAGKTYSFDLEENVLDNERFSIVMKSTGSLSIGDDELKTNLNVWPNPSSNQFHILNVKNDGDTIYEIYTVLGKMIYSDKLQSGVTRTIKTNGWAPGVYILKATNNGNKTTQKLIIQ